MQLLFANNATTTLAGAITSTALSLAVSAGAGTEFPNPTAGTQYFCGTLVDAATGLLNEIVWVTARSTDTMTVTRAREGTTALSWNAGDLFSNLLTAGSLGAFGQNGAWGPGEIVAGVDTGSASHIIITSANTTPTYTATTVPTDLVLIVAPTAVNAGPTDITLNGAKSSVIYPNGSPFLGGETQPRPQVFIYDGANWEWQGQQSPVLQQATTFYVNAASGSDSNNGLTAAAAFATINKACTVVSALNANGQAVTISVANGTYASFALTAPVNGTLTILGNSASPASCIIAATSGACAVANFSAQYTIDGFRLTNSNGDGLYSLNNGQILYRNIDFGPCSIYHIHADNGNVGCIGNYKISGGAVAHFFVQHAYIIVTPSYANTVTLTGTPAFSSGFAVATDIGFIRASTLTTYSGSATGARYGASGNSGIETFGAGASFFPGSTAGSTSVGGFYA